MPDSASIVEAPGSRGRIRNRLISGIGASALYPVVTTIIQVVSVPVFLHCWGEKLYGEWLVLSAIPIYLSLTDFGFGNVAANEMTMQVGKGDRPAALKIFQSAWMLTLSISVLVSAISALLIEFVPFARWLHITLLTPGQISATLFLLVAYVLFGFQANMIGAGFRCDGNFAFGTMLANVVRICEATAVVIVVLAHWSPVSAAAASLGVRVIGNLCLQAVLRSKTSWLRFGFQHSAWSVIRRLFHPAVAYMAFPAGNSLSLQGTLLAVGSVLGPVPVVVFSTLRTMARLAVQLTAVIQIGVWPELSRAHGAGDTQVVRALHRYSCQAAVLISGAIAIVLAIFGNRILSIWTHGQVAMNTPVFMLLLLGVIVNSFWSSSMVALLATNQHGRVAVIYFIATAVSLLAACALMRSFGLIGVAVAMLSVDLLCTSIVVPSSLVLVEDTLGPFCTSMIRVPPALRTGLLQRLVKWYMAG